MSVEQLAADADGESAPPERTDASAPISPLKMRVREISREADAFVDALEEARRCGMAFLDRLKKFFGG